MGISQANFKSGPFALTVSWLLNSYVRGRARKPIVLEDWALLFETSAGARGATYFGTARW